MEAREQHDLYHCSNIRNILEKQSSSLFNKKVHYWTLQSCSYQMCGHVYFSSSHISPLFPQVDKDTAQVLYEKAYSLPLKYGMKERFILKSQWEFSSQ